MTIFDDIVDNEENEKTGNPAWQPFLEHLPEDLHEKVTPVLQDWDRGVKNKIERVHSEYAPYKELKDAGLTPEDIRIGIQLTNMLQEDPRRVWETLGSTYNFVSTPGQGQQQVEEEEDNPLQKRVDELTYQLQTLANSLLSDRQTRAQAEMAAKVEQDLDNEMAQLKKTNERKGPFDEQYVYGLMLNGISGQEAVDKFYRMQETIIKQHSQRPPLLLGSGGSAPGRNFDPRKATDQDARTMAIELLKSRAAAARE